MVVVPLSLILRETPHVPRGTTIRHFVNTAPPNSIPHRIRITTLFQSGTFVHHVSTTASHFPHAPHHARGPFPEIEGSHAAKKLAAIPITGRGKMDHLHSSGSRSAEKVTPASENAATGFPNEEVLPNDYPVYCGYAYVADGTPVISMIEGTVDDLKRSDGFKEVRRCNIFARKASAVIDDRSAANATEVAR
jgi:hypothetical protein